MLTAILYPLAAAASDAVGISQETCVCVGEEWIPVSSAGATALAMTGPLTAASGTVGECRARYRGKLIGVSAQGAIDISHFLSGGAVSFARGLNDTPKIVADPGRQGDGQRGGHPLVGLTIAVGGIVGARRVAETMSHEITALNPGSGLIANATSASLVIVASRYALPVSTTHVTNGALFGIAAITRQAHWQTIAKIILAWVTTLPLAAVLGALAYLIL